MVDGRKYEEKTESDFYSGDHCIVPDHSFSEYTGGYIATVFLENGHVPDHLYATDLHHRVHSRIFGFKMDRSKTFALTAFDLAPNERNQEKGKGGGG